MMPRPRVSSSVTLPPFQKLLDAHGRDMHRFLIATVGLNGADDCYQDACLAALRAYPGLRHTGNLKSWLLTIAHHKAIDHLRARARRPIPVAVIPERPVETVDVTPDGLWEAVDALPPKQRTAVALRYAADAPYEVVAAVMQTSQAAARRNVHEAIKRLREEYPR
jgi:RNA polymerase sigma factor (sigma-70 family)